VASLFSCPIMVVTWRSTRSCLNDSLGRSGLVRFEDLSLVSKISGFPAGVTCLSSSLVLPLG